MSDEPDDKLPMWHEWDAGPRRGMIPHRIERIESSGFHLHSEQLMPGHHLHYETQEDGSVRAKPCDRTDCDKGKPLSGTMAEVFASVKRT